MLLFGAELRSRRLALGLSLNQLSQKVHYSKGQLSKVERGLKPPSGELGRLCDSALGADGALVALVPAKPTSRRRLLAAGAVTAPVLYLGHPAVSAHANHNELTGTFRDLFNHYRMLGQNADPSDLAPVLATQTCAIQELARMTGGNAGRDLLILGSRYAEYTGWLAQETGNDGAALHWTKRAADLADAAGDASFAKYGLVRQALVTLYRHDAVQTIHLARRAQAGRPPPRIAGLAAAREAQGHAIAADFNAAMRAVDRARTLLDAATTDPGQPVIGTTNLEDPAEMIRGWCLYDLGRPREAADVIERQLISVPPNAARARVRYGARCALARAAAGDIDHACVLTSGLLDDVGRVKSATVARDLHTLTRVLGRYRQNPAVRDLSPRLSNALENHSTPKGTEHGRGVRQLPNG